MCLCVVFVCFALALCTELRCLFDHGRDVIVVQVPAEDGSVGSARSNLMNIRQRQLALSLGRGWAYQSCIILSPIARSNLGQQSKANVTVFVTSRKNI